MEPDPGWAVTLAGSLRPGAYAFVIATELVSIEARGAGFELRDTMLILSTGPSARYAFLFRKPTDETTVLGQVTETGAGALNIAATRVGTGADKGIWPVTERRGRSSLNSANDGSLNKPVETDTTVGRWPPNVLFVHGEECQKVGTRQVKASNPAGQGTSRDAPRVRGVYMEGDPNAFRGNGTRMFYGDGGLEVVESWSCESTCPSQILDRLTGDRPSTLTGRADPTKVHTNPGDNHGLSLFGAGNSTVYADSGGASRFYPQFAHDEELFEWMQRLLEAPMGSPSMPPGVK